MRGLLENPKDLAGLASAVAQVSNPTTIQRMIAIAESDEVDATMRQVRVLRERLAEISIDATYTEVEQIITPDGRDAVQTTAPLSPAPRNKGMGRR
jgi:hypothetical protein